MIRIPVKMISRFCAISVFAFAFSGLLICTGCDFSEDQDMGMAGIPDEPVIYTGRTDMATISIANAGNIIKDMFNSSEAYLNIPLPSESAISESLQSRPPQAMVSGHLSQIFKSVVKDVLVDSGDYTMVAVPVTMAKEVRMGCARNGSYVVTGVLDGMTGLGNLTIEFINCTVGGVSYGDGEITYHGVANLSINTISSIGIDGAMDFTYLKLYSHEFSYGESFTFSVGITGSTNFYSSMSGNELQEYAGMNIAGEDYEKGRAFKFENFGVLRTIDDIYLRDSGGSMHIVGPPAYVYDSALGAISVETLSPLRFSAPNDYGAYYPDESGQLYIAGANSSMLFTVISSRHFKLELDLDGDAIYDVERYVYYENFQEGGSINLRDPDDDGMHNDWEIRYNLDPLKADGDLDRDKDGLTNYQEYQQGSYP